MSDLSRQFLRRALERPDQTAAVVADASLSYGELVRAARGLLDTLKLALSKRVTVALDLANSVEFVIAFFAVCVSGNTVAVLDPAWAPRQRERALAMLRTAHTVTRETVRGAVDRARTTPDPPPPAPNTSRGTARPVSATGAHTLSRIPEPTPDPDAPLLIGFTSGTTSEPRAFLRDRGSWSRSLARSCELFAAAPAAVTLVPGPLAHSLSLYALAEVLFSGGTYVGLRRIAPDELAAATARAQPDRLVCVPAALDRLLALSPRLAWHFRLRTVVTGGAKLGDAQLRALWRAAPAVTHHEYYGTSELSFVSYRSNRPRGATCAAGPAGAPALAPVAAACVAAPAASPAATPAAASAAAPAADGRFDVGVVFPGVELRIGTADSPDAPVPAGGTVWVRSDLTAHGYLDASGRVVPSTLGFRRRGAWATVGDLGFIRDGRLHLTGRAGDMLIKNGNNIYPAEIESALTEHPWVAEAAVVIDADRQRLVAAVVLAARLPREAGDRAARDRELRRHLRQRIARYKLPDELWELAALPRTASGKVQRAVLTAQLCAGGDASGGGAR